MELIRLGLRHELWPAELVATLRAGPVMAPEPDLAAVLREQGIAVAEEANRIAIKASPLDELVTLVDRLLGPGGCPWDQAQTHESLKRHLLEEAYEVLDAIDSGSSAQFREELGDLLLQPIMHGQMATKFDTQAVATGIVDKLIRRHPHVFGDVQAADPETVLKNWDQIKATEKGVVPESLLAGVPTGMASLLRAYEVNKRAARAGFEWPDFEAVWEKLREEEQELREAIELGSSSEVAAEVGDLLFTAVNIARWAKVEPEDALRQMLNRFTMRFQAMERASSKPLRELTAEEWDGLWEQAKRKAVIECNEDGSKTRA